MMVSVDIEVVMKRDNVTAFVEVIVIARVGISEGVIESVFF